MSIVAIETCFGSVSVSILDSALKVKTISGIMQNNQSEELLICLERVLEQNNLTKNDITDICVNCGPGSFTGIRVGLSFVEGLSFGLPNLRKHYFSSFAISLGALEYNPKNDICIILKAIGETFYIQFFDQSLKELSQPEYKNLDEILQIIKNKNILLYGNFKNYFSAFQILNDEVAINSHNLMQCFLKHKHLALNHQQPIYLRESIKS